MVKPSQNKKGQKVFQLHRFLNTFSQLPAVKKYQKNGAVGKFLGPSYFEPALVCNSFFGENRTSPAFYHATGSNQEKKTRHYQTTNTFLLVIDKTNIFLYWEGGHSQEHFPGHKQYKLS